jgi:hypothetical protein
MHHLAQPCPLVADLLCSIRSKSFQLKNAYQILGVRFLDFDTRTESTAYSCRFS